MTAILASDTFWRFLVATAYSLGEAISRHMLKGLGLIAYYWGATIAAGRISMWKITIHH